MNDPQLLKEPHIHETAKQLAKRGFTLPVEQLIELDRQRKLIQTETEQLQSDRNSTSKMIGQAIKNGEDVSEIKARVGQINEKLDSLKDNLAQLQSAIHAIHLEIPNIPGNDIPVGQDEDDNIEVKKVGNIPEFDFEVKDHVELGEISDEMSFERGAKISGSRFVVLSGKLARLNRALIAFMLDQHTENGYTEINVPQLVNKDAMIGTGQLPKFQEDQFMIEGGDLSLIPTAEVPVTNLHRESIVPHDQLPIHYVCYSSCFRREAGAYGKDTRGMIRLHQFEKVELVKFVKPEDGEAALESLLADAEGILQKLNLAYRVVTLCTGDTGFSSQKTYDIEVWLPSQNKYREISSCSHFGAFQARRMKARMRDESGKITHLHTLNGSGLAVGRTLVAILENYQNQDGSITVPEALIPYMNGVKTI